MFGRRVAGSVPLVPPYTYRCNSAECVIHTFKNHLCATLAYCDPNLPSQELNRLIPQAVLALNLLRYSHTNPSLSAHAAINGNFDFNATPLVPPGTKFLVHKAASNRPSFSTHAFNSWYIGPSPNHYRCYHCYIPTTVSTRHTNTVEFFPNYFNFPKVTNSTYLCQSAEGIISILYKKHNPSSHPSLSFGSPILNAYLQVSQILQRAAQTPPPTPMYTPLIHGKLP